MPKNTKDVRSTRELLEALKSTIKEIRDEPIARQAGASDDPVPGSNRVLPIYVAAGASVPTGVLQREISRVSPIGVEVTSFEGLLRKLGTALALTSPTRVMPQLDEQILAYPIIEETIKDVIGVDAVSAASLDIVYRFLTAIRYWHAGSAGNVGDPRFADPEDFLDDLIDNNKNVNSATIVRDSLAKIEDRIAEVNGAISRFDTVSALAKEIASKDGIPQVHVIVVDPFPNDHEQAFFYERISENPLVSVHVIRKRFSTFEEIALAAPVKEAGSPVEEDAGEDGLHTGEETAIISRLPIEIKRTVGAHAEGYSILDSAIERFCKNGVDIDDIAVACAEPERKAKQVLRALEQYRVSYPEAPVFDAVAQRRIILSDTAFGAGFSALFAGDDKAWKTFLFSDIAGIGAPGITEAIARCGDTVDALAWWIVDRHLEDAGNDEKPDTVVLDAAFAEEELFRLVEEQGLGEERSRKIRDRLTKMLELADIIGARAYIAEHRIEREKDADDGGDGKPEAPEESVARAEKIVDFLLEGIWDESSEASEYDAGVIEELALSVRKYLNACKRYDEAPTQMIMRLFVAQDTVFSLPDEHAGELGGKEGESDSGRERGEGDTGSEERPRLLFTSHLRLPFAGRRHAIVADLDAYNESSYSHPDAMMGLEREALGKDGVQKGEGFGHIDRWFQQAMTYAFMHDVIDMAGDGGGSRNTEDGDGDGEGDNSGDGAPAAILMYNSKTSDGKDVPMSNVLEDLLDAFWGDGWKESDIGEYTEQDMLGVLEAEVAEPDGAEGAMFKGKMDFPIVVQDMQGLLESTGHRKESVGERELWVLSPTELEDLRRCPVRWLYSPRVLGGYDNRGGAWDDPRTRGEMIHQALDYFYAHAEDLLGDSGHMTEEIALSDECDDLVHEAARWAVARAGVTDVIEKGKAEHEVVTGMRVVLRNDCDYDKKIEGDFHPVPAELDEGDGKYKDIEVEGEYAGIYVKGYIDRVDETEPDENGDVGFIIVDYKGSTASYKPEGSKYDLVPSRIQAAVYASLYERSEHADDAKRVPKGYAYRSYRKDDVKKPIDSDGLAEIEKDTKSVTKMLYAGSAEAIQPPLPDRIVNGMCDYCPVKDECSYDYKEWKGQ